MPNLEFRKSLEELLNIHCYDNRLGVPDFLLAEYIDNHLDTLAETLEKNEVWHGPDSILRKMRWEERTRIGKDGNA